MRYLQRATRVGLLTIAFGIVLALAGTVASTAGAQSSAPEGAECQSYDVTPPATSVWIPGNWDLVILVVDGSEYSYTNVTAGTRLDSPTESRAAVDHNLWGQSA